MLYIHFGPEMINPFECLVTDHCFPINRPPISSNPSSNEECIQLFVRAILLEAYFKVMLHEHPFSHNAQGRL